MENFYTIDGRRVLTFRDDGTFEIAAPLSAVEVGMALSALARAYARMKKERREVCECCKTACRERCACERPRREPEVS